MQKETYNAIRTLLIALVIGVGVSFVSAEVWTEPGCTLPDCNVAAPIHTGTSTQTKAGSINFISDDGSGEIRTDILSVFGTSYFAGDVKVGDPSSAPPTLSTNLLITGRLGVNLDEGVGALMPTPSPSAELDVKGDLRFSELSQLDNPDAPYPAPVCVNDNGTLELCAYPSELIVAVFSPIISNQYLYYDSFENNADDANCSADVSVAGSVVGGTAPISYSWYARYNGAAPLAMINNVDASGGNYMSIGTSTTASFSVDVKNPSAGSRDDWSVKLVATDSDGVDVTAERDFEVWSIFNCAD